MLDETDKILEKISPVFILVTDEEENNLTNLVFFLEKINRFCYGNKLNNSV